MSSYLIIPANHAKMHHHTIESIKLQYLNPEMKEVEMSTFTI